MTDVSQPCQLWDRVTLFDGERIHAQAMSLVVADGRIQMLCPADALSADWRQRSQHMAEGGVVTPGLVDAHTHLVFASHRAQEFQQRLSGVSYADIAAQGGGILSSVRAVRAATEEALYAQSLPRLQAMMQDGVTHIEIKSGYGLCLEDELKMLRVARQLGDRNPIRVSTTFLGAHALPPEYAGRNNDYIAMLCQQMLPAVAEQGLADAVDVFCESIAFSPAQCERVFQAAQALGLPIKIHAEQLSNQHGAALAARYGALSADHLEYLDAEGVAALAAAGTVATLLPGAFLCLQETQRPPVAALREAGVPMAVASDANPGSSPLFQLTLMMPLACSLFGLTPLEALRGVTRHAAQALGDGAQGHLRVGGNADFCVWAVDDPLELACTLQSGRLRQRVLAGCLT